MNSKTIISTLLAISLSAGGLAFADGPGDHNDRGRNEQSRGNDRQDHRDDRGRGQDYEQRGAGPNHQFHKGERLSPEYRNRQYVVDDWRSHRLSAPPRGYQWVQTGGDYVLVAIATGVIMQLLLNH